MIRNLFLVRPETIQILLELLRSLLSFSLCLMGCFAAHQPNARSAQTGVADKLRRRRAAHDPKAWYTERTTLGLDSYCLTTCTYSDDSEFVPGKTGDYPITFRIASRLLSFSLCLIGCFAAHATLLSFSLCLVGRSAEHHQTREAHKPA